ncbi:hypothetical protein HW090_12365 [Pseudomonas sp. ABC1]|uniref:hypothetical protein n=1 Tax=Pseudomonas sp. ABC1 TaxID=2748080 RepID=UPI0015C3D7A1|nr:hypothetical protein [Pseudomonas sp. ABC1]QLF93947.1 hypothetical protein HW090_12365 [Pseudomonas sp. ABC1]
MDTLFLYACAIHGQASPCSITESHEVRSSWQDDDCLTLSAAITYHFADGAVIRRTVEQDEWPDDNACGECWITYEVLQHADAAPIQPPHRHFDNACRERRWLGHQRFQ